MTLTIYEVQTSYPQGCRHIVLRFYVDGDPSRAHELVLHESDVLPYWNSDHPNPIIHYIKERAKQLNMNTLAKLRQQLVQVVVTIPEYVKVDL